MNLDVAAKGYWSKKRNFNLLTHLAEAKEELTRLSQYVEELKSMGKLICREKIESF